MPLYRKKEIDNSDLCVCMAEYVNGKTVMSKTVCLQQEKADSQHFLKFVILFSETITIKKISLEDKNNED